MIILIMNNEVSLWHWILRERGMIIWHIWWQENPYPMANGVGAGVGHNDGRALKGNPGLQYPTLHDPVHTPDNNRWDTPPV